MKVNPIFTRRICVWSLFESEDFLALGNIIAYSHKIRHAISFLCGLFGTNFREFSFPFGQGPNCIQYSCTTWKRRQQLPTLLAQQCWELLRPCWQCCTNKRNDSQQCWDLQCVVGRIQLIRLCKLEFGSHIGACVAPTMLEELCKRLQHCCAKLHRSRNKRNARSCWPTLLRPLARGLTPEITGSSPIACFRHSLVHC